MTARIILFLVSSALLATACGGTMTLQEAAAEFVAPAEFSPVSEETNNTFDEVIRDLRFSTDLSQNEACALAEAALSEWTSDALRAEAQTDALVCGFSVRNPSDHAFSVDMAIIRVSRVKGDDGFVQDPDQAGGVHVISVTFATDK